MKRQLYIIVTAFVFLMLLFGCAATAPDVPELPEDPIGASNATPGTPNAAPETEKPEYKKITPQEAMEMISDDIIILDVRTQEEYNEGHVRNAVLLPHNEIAESSEAILTDKNKTILVYCRSGGRSRLAAEELIELGYTKVYDFGGIIDWTGELVP